MDPFRNLSPPGVAPMSKRTLRDNHKSCWNEEARAQLEVSSSSHKNYNAVFVRGKRLSSAFDGYFRAKLFFRRTYKGRMRYGNLRAAESFCARSMVRSACR